MFSMNVVRQEDAVGVAIVNEKLDLLYLFSIAWEVHYTTPLCVHTHTLYIIIIIIEREGSIDRASALH